MASALILIGVMIILSARPAWAQDQDYLAKVEQHRKEKDEEFRDRDESPLDRKAIRKFKGLKYFPVDEKYRVKARMTLNPSPVLFKMPTTTTRLPEYTKYAELEFELEGRTFRLEVYRNPEINKRPGYEDYLFVPFTDTTNGEETYAMGRYLDFRVPDSDEVFLDFNLAYHPYCFYSDNFSCPIPPAANHLPVAIRAGERQ